MGAGSFVGVAGKEGLRKWGVMQPDSKSAACSLAYQSPANSTFLLEQTSHQQPASSTFLSE
jgi:hypothetical protein